MHEVLVKTTKYSIPQCQINKIIACCNAVDDYDKEPLQKTVAIQQVEKLSRPGDLLVTTRTAPTSLADSTHLWDAIITQCEALGLQLRGGICEAFGTGDGLPL